MKNRIGILVFLTAMGVSTVSHADSLQQSYDGEIRAKIASTAYYPDVAIHRGREGVVALAVTLGNGGAIANTVVEKSSGNKSLDQAALEAVRAAAPFTSAPAGVSVIHTTIRYELVD